MFKVQYSIAPSSLTSISPLPCPRLGVHKFRKWCKNNDVEVSINVFFDSSPFVFPQNVLPFLVLSRHHRWEQMNEGSKKKWKRRQEKIERKLEKTQQQKIKEFSLFFAFFHSRVVVELVLARRERERTQPTDRSLNFNNSLIYVERYFMMAGVGVKTWGKLERKYRRNIFRNQVKNSREIKNYSTSRREGNENFLIIHSLSFFSEGVEKFSIHIFQQFVQLSTIHRLVCSATSF